MFATEYHMGNHRTGRVLNTLQAGSLPAKQPLRKRMDFQAVSQWTRKDYRRAEARGNAQQGETDGNATTARSKGKRGRPRKGSDDETSKTHLYLENADGTLVDSDQIADMSRKACNRPRVLPLAMCPCKFLNRLIVD